MDTAEREPGCIGQLRNNWRRRMVFVYPHPDEDTWVISKGYPIDERGAPTGGPAVICTERRADYARVLSLFPGVAVYD